MPPTTFTNTSCSCSASCACRLAAASSIARRLASSPCAVRRGEQAPPAAARHGDDAAGARLRRARQKNSGRVPDLLQSTRAHGEEAQLVYRAEAVLGGPRGGMAAAALRFQI